MKLSVPFLSLIVGCCLSVAHGALECQTLKFEVGHTIMKVSSDLLKQHPESKLTQEALSDNRRSDCDDPIFFDGNGNTFEQVLDYMRYGKLVLPLTVSTDSFKTDLDLYGIRYNDDDIIDYDTVKQAMKGDISRLRKQIKELFAEVNELKMKLIKAELDKIGAAITCDPFFDINWYLDATGTVIGGAATAYVLIAMIGKGVSLMSGLNPF